MSSIVYQTDKKTGTKYAYESISYWDKEKKQPRSKRKYLGRVDPETGEIIPKGIRVNVISQLAVDTSASVLQEELRLKEAEIAELREKLTTLSKKYERANRALSKIRTISKEYLEE